MWGHEVIDSVVSTLPRVIDPDYSKACHMAMDFMRRAVHFHMGRYGDSKPFIERHKEGAFRGELAEGIRLPYPFCWFDYIHDRPKTFQDNPNETTIPRRGILCGNANEQGSEVVATIFNDWPGLGWVLSPAAYYIYIGDGPTNNKERNIRLFPLSTKILLSTIDPQKVVNEDAHDLIMLNAFLLFLSCKNIYFEDKKPKAGIVRKQKKKKRELPFEYKVLKLKPVGEREKSIPRHLWQNRIHLARGHFKTYTAEAPLLGKHVGRFFWQPHVRGRNRDGMIVKDYERKSRERQAYDKETAPVLRRESTTTSPGTSVSDGCG